MHDDNYDGWKLDNNEQEDHLTFECWVCDEPIEYEGHCGSSACRKADER